MERRGKFVYLTPYEQRSTGYSSPIDLDTFDLHAEREAADAELDRLEQEQAAVDDDAFQTEHFKSVYEAPLARSVLTHEIGKSVARDTLVAEGLTEIENFLQNPTG
jgi:hypothetical protein